MPQASKYAENTELEEAQIDAENTGSGPFAEISNVMLTRSALPCFPRIP